MPQITSEHAGVKRAKEHERLVDVARRIQDPELTVEPIIATARSDVGHGVSAVRARLGLDRPHNMPWQVWSEMNASTPSAKSPPV